MLLSWVWPQMCNGCKFEYHVLFFLLIIDSNSNLAKTVKKSEEPVPVSSGSTRHFREGNALDLGMANCNLFNITFSLIRIAVSVQPGISNFAPIQQSLSMHFFYSIVLFIRLYLRFLWPITIWSFTTWRDVFI